MSIPCPLHRAPVTVLTPSRLKIIWGWQTDLLCLAERLALARTGSGAVTFSLYLSLLGGGSCRGLHLCKLSVVLFLVQMWILANITILFKGTSTIFQEPDAVKGSQPFGRAA